MRRLAVLPPSVADNMPNVAFRGVVGEQISDSLDTLSRDVKSSDLTNLLQRERCFVAPLDVDRMGYGFKMFRVNTITMSARVIQFQSVWNRTFMRLVHQAVRQSCPAIEVSSTVSRRGNDMPFPNPAIRSWVNSVEGIFFTALMSMHEPGVAPLHVHAPATGPHAGWSATSTHAQTRRIRVCSHSGRRSRHVPILPMADGGRKEKVCEN